MCIARPRLGCWRVFARILVFCFLFGDGVTGAAVRRVDLRGVAGTVVHSSSCVIGIGGWFLGVVSLMVCLCAVHPFVGAIGMGTLRGPALSGVASTGLSVCTLRGGTLYSGVARVVSVCTLRGAGTFGCVPVWVSCVMVGAVALSHGYLVSHLRVVVPCPVASLENRTFLIVMGSSMGGPSSVSAAVSFLFVRISASS